MYKLQEEPASVFEQLGIAGSYWCIMAPSDDNNLDDDTSSVKLTCEQPSASSMLPNVSSEANGSLKNIASAINYELPMVNQFLAVHQDLRRRNFSHSVEIPTKSTQELDVAPDQHMDQHHGQEPPPPPASTTVKSNNGRRTSNMENNTPNVLDRRRSDADVSSVAIGHDSHQHPTPPNQGCSSPTKSSTQSNPVKEQQHEQSTTLQLQSPAPTTMQKRRVSTREKQKREIPLSRSRVKYDMQLVPFVRRNPLFLQQFIPPWWLSNKEDLKCESTMVNQDEGGTHQSSQQLPPTTQHRRSSRFVSTPAITTTESIPPEADPPQPCQCHGAAVDSTNPKILLLPFAITETHVESVIWAPQKRSEWEDTISEMTAVYTAAAFRRHTLDLVEKQQGTDPSGNLDGTSTTTTTTTATSRSNEPFAKPLSIDYIRDRIDIDDPLYGYQVRHKFGGWMQGFILYTTFTTWNFGFEFNSQHPLCGIPPPPSDAVSDVDHNRYVDYDNSLAMELEALPRSGDPRVGGIVFSEIAEISILGALGCGEYLLRMALDDIYTNKQNYKYVILHAADQARAFYEKFGFKRVGAVCKYCKKQNIPLTPTPNALLEPPEVLGYRHWTHANEAILHDAPSYMMCLKLPDRSKVNDDISVDSCLKCHGIISRPPRPGEFLRQMLQFQVPSKPRIEPLGTSTVLGLKHLSRRSHSMPLVAASSSFESQSSCPNMTSTSNVWTNPTAGKRGNAITGTGTKISRRKSLACGTQSKSLSFRSSDVPSASLSMRAASLNPLNGSLTNASRKNLKSEVKRPPSWRDASPTNHRPTKRLKVERTVSSTIAHESVLSGPKRSSFIEKQYNSVWLAVPPNIPGTVSPHRERAPPKSRTDAAVVARKPRRKLSNSAAPMHETSGNNRTMLPVIEEGDERKNGTNNVHATTNEPSRRKRSMLHCVSKDEEATMKDSSTVQPPVKISRKRTFADSIAKSEKTKASNCKDTATEMSPSPPRRSLFDMMASEESASSIDTSTLRKQKVLSYPRNRTHYYNRVVRENVNYVDGTAKSCTKGNDDATCYFVLEYDKDKGLICIVPMIVRGVLTGKRIGRPRYQCQMDHKFRIVEAEKFYIVPSAMIMKTPIVAQEAWDIATKNDTDFLTR